MYKAVEDDSFYLIVLSGLSLERLFYYIQWVQSVSYLLKHPALIIKDGVPSKILVQLEGCNVIFCNGKENVRTIKRNIKAWVGGNNKSIHYIKNNRLSLIEWTVLITYIKAKSMSKVAKITNRNLKTAYKDRKMAMAKLGFQNMNELFSIKGVF